MTDGPLWSGSLGCTPYGRLYFDVKVFRTRRDMVRWLKGRAPQAARATDRRTAAAVHCRTRRERRGSPRLGTIVFNINEIGGSILVHELLHALAYWQRAGNVADEERLALSIEHMAGSLFRGFDALGLATAYRDGWYNAH